MNGRESSICGPSRGESVTEQSELFERAMYMMTGEWVDWSSHERSRLGIQAFIRLVYGRRRSRSSVKELTTLANPKAAEETGWEDGAIVPPCFYPRLAVCLWIYDDICDLTDGGVRIGNYWRPANYNALVGGSDRSAHIEGCAMDLDFESRRDVNTGLRYLESIYLSPWPLNLGMGIGKGGRRIHFDVFSSTALDRIERGKRPTRWWKYKSDPEYRGPGSI